ncbi:MAG: hypothetical protein JXB29_01945 [Sedimentisphaerales bacterium]|nr:hypothetical protein [Sedimentisphaerales bacterium]
MAKTAKKPDLQNLPACAAEFIKLVVKKMRYRRKVRNDVRAELAAHFEDELKQCKSDPEKQEKARQLIENFGDAKLLGVLLRRAKKRCRPLWRTIFARTFQTFGVLILSFIIYCFYISLGEPSINVNYIEEATRLARPIADENLNAAALYQKAIDAYSKPPLVAHDTSTEQIDLLKAIRGKDWPTDLTKEELASLKQCLSDNTEAIAFFRQASQKPHCWWKREAKDDIIWNVLMPELSSIRNLAKMIVWQVKLKAYNGDVEGAFDDLLACCRTAQHFKGPRSLVDQLVGIAIQALSLKSAIVILENQQVSSQLLKSFQAELEKLMAEDTYIMNYETERFYTMDFVQRCYTDNGKGSGHLIPGQLKEFMAMINGEQEDEDNLEDVAQSWLLAILGANRRKIVSEFNQFYDIAQDKAHKTPWQLREEKDDLEMEVEKWSTLMRARYWPIQVFMPALSKISELSYRIKADTEATLTIIAIFRYKQDVGAYPEKLEALIKAGYLKQLPMDPWSDKPLVYKKTDDGFMLYGVGRNFKDDSGEVARGDKGRVKRYADEGDWVFWPVQR